MAAGLIQQDTRSEGGVEGFDVLGGDADRGGVAFVVGGDAAAFVADKDGGRVVEGDLVDTFFGAGVGGIERELAGFDFSEEGVPIGEGEGETEEGAGGGAEGFGVPGIGGTFEEDDAGGAEGFSGADDGAGVAGVLDAVEGDGESLAFEDAGEGLFVEREEGDEALAVFDGGDLGEDGVVDEVAVDGRVQLLRGLFGGDDGADVGAGAAGFVVQMEAFGDGETVVGAGAALDGFADAFEKRMVNAEHSYRLLSIARRRHSVGFLRGLAVVGGVCLLLWLGWVTVQIRAQSTVDEAQAADVIVVMGAAEYRGKPSPVLKARLDHGLGLYNRKLAPWIVTTGGAGGDPVFTEGTVGRNYLIGKGVPSESIILEDEGGTTVHSTVAVAEIMSRMGLESCILVSDGYHIFRAKKMLESRGLRVYGSPRTIKTEAAWRDWWLYARQAVGYGLWRIGVPI